MRALRASLTALAAFLALSLPATAGGRGHPHYVTIGGCQNPYAAAYYGQLQIVQLQQLAIYQQQMAFQQLLAQQYQTALLRAAQAQNGLPGPVQPNTDGQ